ncbi:MAG: hypothetical protein MJY56_01315 [Bacteroidales bacterium]|nr:hypothetical protein [Bacteroidales bacterium]
MNDTLKLIAAAALALTMTACNKDNSKSFTDFSGGCEAVDLGLSVKWASYNIGAISEYNAGAYFAWGETTEKEKYGWSGSKDYMWGVYDFEASPLFGMTKYTPAAGGDGLDTLQPDDDPATKVWGTKWRTPTSKEIDELLDKSKCQWTWDDSRKGYIIEGLRTGNTIFLPAAGQHNGSDFENDGVMGFYWSSSVDESRPSNAIHLRFDRGIPGKTSSYRSIGQSVRAVSR